MSCEMLGVGLEDLRGGTFVSEMRNEGRLRDYGFRRKPCGITRAG